MTEDPFEEALRASLRAHADRAPLDGDVVARTLAAAGRAPTVAPVRRRREWRTWGFPLLAAGAVGAIVAAVVGLEHVSRHEAAPATHEPTSVVSTGSSATPPAPPVPVVTRTVTATATTPTSSGTTTVRLHDIRVDDLTFTGPDHGWALGSARCLTGSGRCTAVLRTTDGRTWAGIPGGLFNVDGVHGCADPCVSHLRFATDRIGYAYGPDAVLMTTNGGATWQRQGSLGADALETLDGNVILVRGGNNGRLFLRAPIGSSAWKTITGVPASVLLGNTFALARNSGAAYLLATGNPAVGTSPSVLYRSGDDGVTWHRSGGLCPQIGDGYVAFGRALATAADGSAVVACQVNGPNGTQTGLTVTSPYGGTAFAQPPNGGKLSPPDLLGIASRDVQVAATSGGVYRSTDRGDSWSRVSQVSGAVIFVGFENGTTGRIVGDGGRTIYTTHDAGRNWSKVVLP